MKATIFLAVICGGALIASTTMLWAGASVPQAVPTADAAEGADLSPASPASLARLHAQEARLRISMAPTAAVISRTSNALELWYPARLAFAPDSTELLATGTAMLDLLARSLKEHEQTAVVVAVYTDAIGSTDYNQHQSLARAAAVVAYLEAKGVPPDRMVARGGGESAPLEAPNTPEGRDLNRRLQVMITPLS